MNAYKINSTKYAVKVKELLALKCDQNRSKVKAWYLVLYRRKV